MGEASDMLLGTRHGRVGGRHGIRLGIDGRELRAETPTGIGRYVMGVLRAASGDGCECLVYGGGGTRLRDTLPGVRLRVLPGRWTQWWDQVTLARELGRDGVSAFLSPYYKGPLFAPCPVVVTIHDLFFLEYLGQRRWIADGARRRLGRLYARRAAAIIADSEYAKRAAVAQLGVDAGKVTVIPVGVDGAFAPGPLTEPARRRYGIAPPYVLYVGNFKPHKNLPRLLRAFARLPASLLAAHQLVLAGGDPASGRALTDLARGLGIGDRVVLPGPIEEADLPALYGGAALFVLPSLEEGFGLPALEALACGTPVVAADRAAIPEVVGDAALLVDPEDEAALAAAMARVLTAPDLAERLRRRGPVRARLFSAERTAGRVVDLLRRVSAAGVLV